MVDFNYTTMQLINLSLYICISHLINTEFISFQEHLEHSQKSILNLSDKGSLNKFQRTHIAQTTV